MQNNLHRVDFRPQSQAFGIWMHILILCNACTIWQRKWAVVDNMTCAFIPLLPISFPPSLMGHFCHLSFHRYQTRWFYHFKFFFHLLLLASFNFSVCGPRRQKLCHWNIICYNLHLSGYAYFCIFHSDCLKP